MSIYMPMLYIDLIIGLNLGTRKRKIDREWDNERSGEKVLFT